MRSVATTEQAMAMGQELQMGAGAMDPADLQALQVTSTETLEAAAAWARTQTPGATDPA
jgi:hypothetical protein